VVAPILAARSIVTLCLLPCECVPRSHCRRPE